MTVTDRDLVAGSELDWHGAQYRCPNPADKFGLIDEGDNFCPSCGLKITWKIKENVKPDPKRNA